MQGSNEIKIAEYLIAHGDCIKSDLRSKATGLDANSLYSEQFEKEVVSEVIMLLTQCVNLSYIEIAEVVNEDYLISLLGREWFKL